MEALLGFSLDFWDYATFAAIAFLVLCGLGLAGQLALSAALLTLSGTLFRVQVRQGLSA